MKNEKCFFYIKAVKEIANSPDEFWVAHYIFENSYSFENKTFKPFKKSIRKMCLDINFWNQRLQNTLNILIEKGIVIKTHGETDKSTCSYNINPDILMEI